MNDQAISPGWYESPNDTSKWRYFDGSLWTDKYSEKFQMGSVENEISLDEDVKKAKRISVLSFSLCVVMVVFIIVFVIVMIIGAILTLGSTSEQLDNSQWQAIAIGLYAFGVVLSLSTLATSIWALLKLSSLQFSNRTNYLVLAIIALVVGGLSTLFAVPSVPVF